MRFSPMWQAPRSFRYPGGHLAGDFDGDGKTNYMLQIQTKERKHVMIVSLWTATPFIGYDDRPTGFSPVGRVERCICEC